MVEERPQSVPYARSAHMTRPQPRPTTNEAGARCAKRRPLVEFEGSRVELVVHALLSDQIVVAAALDDASLLQDHDRVGVPHRREAVGDDETVRPSMRLSMPCCTWASVRVSIEEVASSRIIAGGSATAARAIDQELRLPLRQVRAVTCQHRVVAVGQATNESALASFAASMHSSSVASRRP